MRREAPSGSMPVEGATRANGKTSVSEIEGEAPQAMPAEGATLAPIMEVTNEVDHRHH